MGISKFEKRNNFFVQVRNFLLPLSLKVFRHKERETQSFYSGFFICPTPTCLAPATKVSTSKQKPTSPEAGLISSNWLFQNLPKSSAHFQCVTSFALASLRFPTGLLWYLWVTRSLCACARNPCVNIVPK